MSFEHEGRLINCIDAQFLLKSWLATAEKLQRTASFRRNSGELPAF
jgi:hypothetical protein